MHSLHFYRVGLIIFVFAWIAPNHFPPWASFHSEALAIVSVCLLLLSQLLSRNFAFAAPTASKVLALTIFVPWIQLATGTLLFAGDALVVTLYILGLIAAISIGYSYASTHLAYTHSVFIRFMQALFAAALLSGIIGLLQWLGLQDSLQIYAVQAGKQSRALGNLGQPNHLATLLLMGIVALMFIYENKKIGAKILILLVVFLSSVLVLTQSRTALVSVLVLVVFLVWKCRRTKLRIPVNLIVMWAILFFAVTALFHFAQGAGSSNSVRNIADPSSIAERFLFWQQILFGLLQSPWNGYGWNQTVIAQTIGAIYFPGSSVAPYAHNFILDMLTWNGLPLGVILTGLLAYWFISRLKMVIRADGVFAMACLLPFAVHSMFEYPFAYSYFLLTAGLMVGVVEGAMARPQITMLKRGLVLTTLLASAVIGGWLSYEYTLVEEDFRIVRFENLRVGITPAEYQVPHVWMNTHLAALLKSSRQSAKPDMSYKQLKNLEEVALRFPYGPTTFRYGLALGLNGDPSGAGRQMAIIRGLYGARYYRAAKEQLLILQKEKYPQLKLVAMP